jgi:hypothetical protein
MMARHYPAFTAQPQPPETGWRSIGALAAGLVCDLVPMPEDRHGTGTGGVPFQFSRCDEVTA